MPYTQTQLINAVYAEVAVSQDAPSTDDVTTITTRLADIVADLAARRVTGTITLSQVADAIFTDLVKVVAERVAPFFGRPTNKETLEAAEARLAQSYRRDRTLWTPLQRSVLERLDAVGADALAIDGTAVANVVQQVLDDLASRRVIVLVNEAAVGSQHLTHVVTLVAARCQPKAVSAADVQAAINGLATIDRLASTTGLARAIVEQLEAWGAGTLAIDTSAASRQIQQFLDGLAARGVIYFPDETSITTAAYQPIKRYIAAWLAPSPKADVIAQAERELRLLSVEDGTGEVLTADYF